MWKPKQKYAWARILIATFFLVAGQAIVLWSFPFQLPLFLISLNLFVTAVYLFSACHERSALFAFGLSAAAITLATVETVALQFQRSPVVVHREAIDRPETSYDDLPETSYDDKMFYTLKAGSWHEVGMISERVVWECTQTVANDGSRIVPRRPVSGPVWGCFGGSFTFGHHLNDDETIPAVLQTADESIRVYNYGINGHGTADVYFQIQKRFAEHPSMSCCIYFMIDGHINRVGLPDWHLARMEVNLERPRFTLIDGALAYLGKARDSVGPIWRLHIELCRKVWLLRRLNRMLFDPSDAAMTTTQGLVTAMRQICEQRGCRFLLVRLPGENPNEAVKHSKLYTALTEADVIVVDLHQRLKQHVAESGDDWSGFYLPNDGHPNSAGNRLFAQWTLEALSKLDSAARE